MQRDLETEENRLFAQQMEAQRKAIVIQDRAKNRGLQDVRKGMDEYNKLKAEEMKKKAFNAYHHTQTYKNEWSAQLIIICMRAKVKVWLTWSSSRIAASPPRSSSAPSPRCRTPSLMRPSGQGLASSKVASRIPSLFSTIAAFACWLPWLRFVVDV